MDNLNCKTHSIRPKPLFFQYAIPKCKLFWTAVGQGGFSQSLAANPPQSPFFKGGSLEKLLNELQFQNARKKRSNSQTTGPSDPGGWFVGRSSTCRRLSATHRPECLRTNLDCARAASGKSESSTEPSPRTPCHSAPPARSLRGGGYATVALLPTPGLWQVVRRECAVSPWFLQTAQGPRAWRFHPPGQSCPTHCTGPASSTRRHR